jgi:hypothetical protein
MSVSEDHPCPNECSRPWDQGEGRYCPECCDYKPTCANDHCLECGAST